MLLFKGVSELLHSWFSRERHRVSQFHSSALFRFARGAPRWHSPPHAIDHRETAIDDRRSSIQGSDDPGDRKPRPYFTRHDPPGSDRRMSIAELRHLCTGRESMDGCRTACRQVTGPAGNRPRHVQRLGFDYGPSRTGAGDVPPCAGSLASTLAGLGEVSTSNSKTLALGNGAKPQRGALHRHGQLDGQIAEIVDPAG